MNGAQSEQRVQTVCLLLLTAAVTAASLYWLRPVMIPFVMALLFALILSPLIDLQMRYLRAPRAVALIGTLLLGFLGLLLVGAVVSDSVNQLSGNVQAYKEHLNSVLQSAAQRLPLERFGIDPNRSLSSLVKVPVQTVGGVLLGTTNAILDLLSRGLLVLVFLLFLLTGEGFSRRSEETTSGQVAAQIKRYVLAQAVISAATGLLVGASLALLGVDLALLFGFLAFLLNFIPTIGSIVATLLPLPMVLISPHATMTTVVLVLAIPGLIQFTIGSVIAPKVMGETLDLHPVTILLALIFWGMLWGIPGALLATPITVIMKLMFTRMELTAPLSNWMAGRFSPAAAR
jgi:AI-2 transport protein TqsA